MDFSTKLTNWYLKNKRKFPWRNTKVPYYIWLSEIILQQTKTSQGLPYYIKFITHFPKIEDLASAKESEILKLWQGLGYYSRARNLHFSAKYIVNELHGKFPKNYKDLLLLKGVGDYTASAIASICYNENCAVVDGNVYRVLARYFGIITPINSSKGIKEFKLLAQAILPNTNFGIYNQAIMDFGATICSPKKPNCVACIFKDSCVALQKKSVHNLPIKTSKTKIKHRFFNYLVILSKNEQIILNKRTGKGIWQNLYEFPLIEFKTEIELNQLITSSKFNSLFKNRTKYTIQLFNPKEILHKLSHQHLHTKFWVIKTNISFKNSISIQDLKKYAVPTLIDNFISEFEF